MACPNCNRLERLLYAQISANSAALTSAGLQSLGVNAGLSNAAGELIGPMAAEETIKAGRAVGRGAKRKVSAYNRKYKAAFKKVAPRYKLKNGKWSAGGFKKAVKEAHRIAGGKKR